MLREYDQRQFNKMEKLIVAFKQRTISLSSFVSSLEFLFQALENVNQEWEELFLEEITTLESVNSGLPPNVSQNEIEIIISESIKKLSSLIKESLQS